jgi:ribosomal protein S18 acetylase RimI-like enzyme
VVTFRSFHNCDPPQLIRLWNECGLGRGAAELTANALEMVNFSQPYFDGRGLILAEVDGRVVGMIHAGFSPQSSEAALDKKSGVICMVMVAPQFRRRGIGRALVDHARAYLVDAGADTITVGGSPGGNPFYVGLYGGSQPAGFLDSDPDAAPFFEALDFNPQTRHLVYQRNIANSSDSINFRLMQNRRKFELSIVGGPDAPSWWWMTRFGRLDSLSFLLVPKSGGAAVASVTVLGLDLFLAKWRERSVGLVDLWVTADLRRKGLGQTLLCEVGRRLRDELVTTMEIHADQNNQAMQGLLASCGFLQVDTGTVFH